MCRWISTATIRYFCRSIHSPRKNYTVQHHGAAGQHPLDHLPPLAVGCQLCWHRPWHEPNWPWDFCIWNPLLCPFSLLILWDSNTNSFEMWAQCQRNPPLNPALVCMPLNSSTLLMPCRFQALFENNRWIFDADQDIATQKLKTSLDGGRFANRHESRFTIW